MYRLDLLRAATVGFDTLRVNPMRTALSTLGVIIGVAAMVAVLALGGGMERYVPAEIERTTDVPTVFVAPTTSETVDGRTFPRRDYPVFSARDAAEAARSVEGARAVTLLLAGR